MPVDADRLLDPLVALADAIDVVTASCRYETGYQAYGFPEAPRHPRVEGEPPYDGRYRGSFISKALCLRLDLRHPSVPAELRERLSRAFPAQVGGDQAFYEYCVDERATMRINRDEAVLSLALKIESVSRG
jgi:hypothetical protein